MLASSTIVGGALALAFHFSLQVLSLAGFAAGAAALGLEALVAMRRLDAESGSGAVGGARLKLVDTSAIIDGRIADLAATPEGQEPRASGTLAYHVLDVMESLLDSAHTGKAVAVESRADRPAAVPLSCKEG